MNKPLYIIGTGGFAREVLCLIRDLGRYDQVKAFVEADAAYSHQALMNIPVIPQSQFDPDGAEVIIAIGDPATRHKVSLTLPQDTDYATLIHPSVIMSPWVRIGAGSIICARTTLTCEISLGKHTQLNLHTTVGHDCVLEDYVTTAPAVNISGRCHLAGKIYVGTNASIRQNIRIAEGTTIGMGAVVVKDITEPGIYVGNPCKKIK